MLLYVDIYIPYMQLVLNVRKLESLLLKLMGDASFYHITKRRLHLAVMRKTLLIRTGLSWMVISEDFPPKPHEHFQGFLPSIDTFSSVSLRYCAL